MPGENPREHGENMQTRHRKAWGLLATVSPTGRRKENGVRGGGVRKLRRTGEL